MSAAAIPTTHYDGKPCELIACQNCGDQSDCACDMSTCDTCGNKCCYECGGDGEDGWFCWPCSKAYCEDVAAGLIEDAEMSPEDASHQLSLPHYANVQARR